MTLGCFHDDVRMEPRAWVLVGFLPEYSARRARRPRNGPFGTPRRVMELTHAALRVFLEDFIKTTQEPEILLWADGKERPTHFFLALVICDQQEADKLTGESSQTCKRCKCPRAMFDVVDNSQFNFGPGLGSKYETRSSSQMQKDVIHAYTCPYLHKGKSFSALFMEDGPHHDRVGESVKDWKPIPMQIGLASQYEEVRKRLGGAHMVYNAFSDVPGFDILQSVS